MELNIFEKLRKCTINTGNILSLNDITRKTTQNPTEEFSEAINITIKEFENNEESMPQEGNTFVIHRPNDDLAIKIAEQELSDLKIGLKLFLNNNNKSFINESLEQAFHILKVSQVDSVIIAYKPGPLDAIDIQTLQSFWAVLEELVKEQKIQQIGLADVEESVFRDLYQRVTVKPKIIQINLATCCVVPPTLQAFCKDNDVQLLTHSDPVEFLPQKTIQETFGERLRLQWILRYLVHIKCRGVLITKGYLVDLSEK